MITDVCLLDYDIVTTQVGPPPGRSLSGCQDSPQGGSLLLALDLTKAKVILQRRWPTTGQIWFMGLIRFKGGFPRGSASKESACNAGDPSSISGSGRSPGEGNGCSLQYAYLENSMESYSPWGRKLSDMTEGLTHTHTRKI